MVSLLAACWLLFFLVSAHGFCEGNISWTEYFSLWDLYNCTNGSYWHWSPLQPVTTIWQFTWNLSAPCLQQWQGLQCKSTITSSSAPSSSSIASSVCSISAINLTGYNLNGLLPLTLGDFLNLEVLDLHRNKLTGSMPSAVGNLSSLQVLSLAANHLTGSLPTLLGILVNLQQLHLSNNSIYGTIPTEFGNLWKLRELMADSNNLDGEMPWELGNISELTVLDFGNNHLASSIPSVLGKLSSLRVLSVYLNSLNGSIPPDLNNCSNLVQLLLYDNYLEGTIPTELAGLNKTVQLELNSNCLVGSIPSALGQLQSLVSLSLFENRLRGTIPSQLGNCKSLGYLYLFDNSLTGSIPWELGRLMHLRELLLHENLLIGEIPKELGSMSSLLQLVLYSNRLNGTIPSQLGNLTNLLNLDVAYNSLTGSMPDLQGARALLGMDFSFNRLRGSIPETFAGFHPFLVSMFLQNNNFGGSLVEGSSIPASISHLIVDNNLFAGSLNGLTSIMRLHTFSASNNSFAGSLPKWKSASFLQSIDLSNNRLAGSIGFTLMNATSLQSISLGRNSLTGSIPKYIGDLSQLQSLNLSSNQLVGDVAALTGSLNSLEVVDLSNNLLTGVLPIELISKPKVHTVILFNNCIRGPLPSSICTSTTLQNLVLDNLQWNCGSAIPKSLQWLFSGAIANGISLGTLPECIWGMPNLEVLHLSGNRMKGSLADHVANNNTNLGVLVMSSNVLTGTIPTWVQISKTLRQLDLSSNRLSGTLSKSVAISPSATLYRLSGNRLSGDIPAAFFAFNRSSELNVLRGNLWSCWSGAQVSWAEKWGVPFQSGKLPTEDPHYQDYICGSSSFDRSLLLAVIAVIVVIMVVGFVWTPQMKKWVDNSIKIDIYLSLMIRSRLWVVWRVVLPLLLALLIFYTIIKSCRSAAEFSTHAVQYLWVSTAAFMKGWLPAMVILLAMTIGLCAGVGLRRDPSEEFSDDPDEAIFKEIAIQKSDSALASPALRIAKSTLSIAAVHLLNITVVVTINALYVTATVNGLPEAELFVVQLFLGMFKLFWNNLSIPTMIRQVISKRPRAPHCLFMSLFTLLGGPFLSTFFSSGNCFLNTIRRTQSLPSSVVSVPQYQCEPSCYYGSLFGKDTTSIFSCTAKCEFQTVEIAVSTTPPWVYSFQCSSELLVYYIPVMIMTIIISATFRPLVSLILLNRFKNTKEGVVSKWFTLFFERSLLEGDSPTTPLQSSLLLGQRIRVKMLVDVTVLLTFGLASPLLGLLILFDNVMGCLTWHVLIGKGLELLRCKPDLRSVDDTTGVISTQSHNELSNLEQKKLRNSRAEEFLSRCVQSLKDASQRPVDHFMMFWFVSIFWCLFMFDMVGVVGGVASGVMVMLLPFFLSGVIWIFRYHYKFLHHIWLHLQRRLLFPVASRKTPEIGTTSSGKTSALFELATPPPVINPMGLREGSWPEPPSRSVDNNTTCPLHKYN